MRRDFSRGRRIEDQIQRILSDLVRAEARDPRLSALNITGVEVSRDLGVAWVDYTVLSLDDADAEPLAEALEKALPFLRRRLAGELRVRRVPELRFRVDDSLERAEHLEKLIDDAVAEDTEAGGGESADDG